MSAAVTVGPPTTPTEPLTCDYNRVSCGTVTVESTHSDIGAVPVGHYVATLSGTAHLRRLYGCTNARGRRLHRYDTVVSPMGPQHPSGAVTTRPVSQPTAATA